MVDKLENIYFASDFHLGVPDRESSLKRELLIVRWLDEISPFAKEVFLMGDIFDFWFEYKTVVPKGYVRLLGKIAELTDKGIPVHIFRGNHDIWAFDYLKEETGVLLYRQPIIRDFGGKKFFLGHGDGLGPGDNGYKLLKRVFENKVNQFFFSWLHPDIGTRMGLYFSHKSRIANIAREQKNDFKVEMEKEMLYIFCKKTIKEQPDINFFVFGHRHIPIDQAINENSRMIILGDWVTNFTYAVFDGNNMELKKFVQ